MSQIILTKRQFEFIREDLTDSESNKKPTFSVSNSETDNNTSSLAKDISTANQHNANANPLSIQTASYTNKTIPSKNNAQVMTIPNGPDAAQKVSKIINTTSASEMPGSIRLVNGVERDNNKIIEQVTFSKKELDNFLDSI